MRAFDTTFNTALAVCVCVLGVVLLINEGGPVIGSFLSVTVHISLCTTNFA